MDIAARFMLVLVVLPCVVLFCCMVVLLVLFLGRVGLVLWLLLLLLRGLVLRGSRLLP